MPPKRTKRKAADESPNLPSSSLDPTSTNPTPAPNPPPKKPRTRQPRAPSSSSNPKPARKPRVKKLPSLPPFSSPEPDPVLEPIPWPPHFTHLSHVHRALNIVYTFLSLRPNFATTFENLKSAVEEHIKPHPLLVSEMRQIRDLVPRGVSLEEIDEERLMGYYAGGEVGEEDGERNGEGNKVLVFEFVDGDLGRGVVARINSGAGKEEGEKGRGKKGKKQQGTEEMMKLIEKRNAKFKNAVDGFLRRCKEEGVDATERLKQGAAAPVTSASVQSPGDEERAAAIPKEVPTERKLIPEIIEELKKQPFYCDQIVPGGHHVFEPHPAEYGDLDFQLSQSLVNALYSAHNITRFYSHQAAAINALHTGENVIVSTATSSGKSLIYQVPVLHALEQDPQIRAMFIFPTKALAQDQKRSLKEVMEYMADAWVDGEMPCVETFDGDTERGEERRRIREEARVIFTNPDMLHASILPNEERWRGFLKELRLVVVDELHVYNGLFGTHVAWVMRRLRRVCAAVGNNSVRFVSCSATIANPEEHMKKLFGLDSVTLISHDGSPSGSKTFLCWNTPYKDPSDPSSGRGNYVEEAAKVFCQLLLHGVRTISFCRVRTVCEVLLQAVKHELKRLERPEVAGRVMAYRGGYTPEDRRRIEKEMFEGALLGIVATNALELGVDIGSLDAVIIVNFPYSISALRQQSGRAGRRNKDSLSILLAGGSPLDQHYMTSPHTLFTTPSPPLHLDLANTLILTSHLHCAAYELPIHPIHDIPYFSSSLPTLCSSHLTPEQGGFYYSLRDYPVQTTHLRDAPPDELPITIISTPSNKILESLEPSRAIFTLYPGGIYLHQGHTYLIRSISLSSLTAIVSPVKVTYTTKSRDFTDVDPVSTALHRRIIPTSTVRAFFGMVKITSTVFGYYKLDRNRRIIDTCLLDGSIPPYEKRAPGFWIDLPAPILATLKTAGINPAAAIHAASHAVINLLPTLISCTSSSVDVGTECKAVEKEVMQKRQTTRIRPARLIFFDEKGGEDGSGVCKGGFEKVEEVVRRAMERVRMCGCEIREGCAECCCGDRCREGNGVLSKQGARVVLGGLLGEEVAGLVDEGWREGTKTVDVAGEIGGGEEWRDEGVVSEGVGNGEIVEID